MPGKALFWPRRVHGQRIADRRFRRNVARQLPRRQRALWHQPWQQLAFTDLQQSGLRESKGREACDRTTWDRFVEITKAHEGTYFGTVDAGADEAAFENWPRQLGETEISDWLALWVKMCEMKACPPADIQALDRSGPDTSLLTQGRASCAFNHPNQFVDFQAINKAPLGITAYSQGARPNPGQRLKPSMIWGVYSRTKTPDVVVKFADFSVKDPDAARILGVERGVPPSPTTKQMVSDQLDDMSRKVVDFIAQIFERVGPAPPAPPHGAGEVQVLLRGINEQVGFGHLSASAGGKQYLSEAKSTIARGR